MGVIYHLVQDGYLQSQPPDRPYTPAGFAREGFIHCTRGEDQLIVVANRYYRSETDVLRVLVIDEAAVDPEIKYEPGGDGVLYPHIYGPLNRSAIVQVRSVLRQPDGSFGALA